MKTLTIIAVILFIFSCASQPQPIVTQPQEVLIKIQGVDAVKVEEESDGVMRSMTLENPECNLSHLSFIAGGEGYIKIFSGISVADVTMFWNDLIYIEKNTEIRRVNIFINSPGGDAFSGLALADQIERAKGVGFEVVAHASGIIASAAVPVFAVCDIRLAAPGTIFMVHEAALWKWPGRETASDIRSQNELMVMLRDKYIEKLVSNSNLSKDEWEELERKTTWFSAEKALSWGLVDRIE